MLNYKGQFVPSDEKYEIISVCPKGLYGPNCQHECPCKNNGTCDSEDGSCNCPAGYYGATCSEGTLPFITTPGSICLAKVH